MTTDPPSRASLRNAISNSMARIKREFYGKGPSRTRTFICDRVIFSILDDPLTTVEIALRESGRSGLVRRTRLTFEDIMTRTFTSTVEELTGARVLAYHSQVVFDPDAAIEIFVLDRVPWDSATEQAPADVRSGRLERPGAVGDADALPGPDADEPVLGSTGRQPRRPARQLEAAVANAVTRLVHEQWGKGPIRTRAYIEDRFVFCVLEEPFTTVENTLIESGETDLVRELRIEAHELLKRRLADQVGELTGCHVRASHCQVVFEPDVLFAIFILDDGTAQPGA
jgi:uncharacterized protein YbcI